MTRLSLAIVLSLLAAPVSAACFVDYKAKKDDPLQLHYGVIELDDADCEEPETIVAERIAEDGWSLLAIVGTLTEEEAEEKEADAGAYFLRY